MTPKLGLQKWATASKFRRRKQATAPELRQKKEAMTPEFGQTNISMAPELGQKIEQWLQSMDKDTRQCLFGVIAFSFCLNSGAVAL